MATLTDTKIKDTYRTLLKITSSSIDAGFSVVQDGDATDSGLSLSTTGIGVSKVTFTSAPVAGTTETEGLFLNSSSEIVSRTLVGSAFQLPDVQGGSGITITGGFPTFTVVNSAPDQTVALTGVDIAVSGAYPNFTLTNSAPDQTVAITGSGGVSVTGTYPTFNVDASSITGVHEEMFVGVIPNVYFLGASSTQILDFTAPDNETENTSYHFGQSPAKLSQPAPSEILNSSGSPQVVYVDIAAYIDVLSPNSDITYKLQTNTGLSWVTKQQVIRTKGSAGIQVDSFWGVFIINDGEKMRIVVESTSGNVNVTPQTQVKFQVKEKGNII